MRIKQQEVSKAKAISYRVKDKSVCKVCGFEHNREQLHSGGGRLIAGKLTSELRRLYEVSKKYGKVYPLAYSMLVCPQCLYSSFTNDFGNLTPDEVEKLKKATLDRRTSIEKIVGPIDFGEERNLVGGAASYLLAIDCYQMRGMQVAPTPKKAICALRGAWLFQDMAEEFPKLGFEKIAEYLYLKSVSWYIPTLEIMTNGREPHDQFVNLLGPDTDNNWSFDGVIYINGYLTKRYLNQLAPTKEKKLEYLDRSKRYLGKLYGMGRASKSKPSIIIDMAKELYEELQKEMDILNGVPQTAAPVA